MTNDLSSIEVRVPVGDAGLQEAVIGELGDLATGFVQEEDAVLAYVPEAAWDAEAAGRLKAWLEAHDVPREVETRSIPEENWNAAWEETVRPLRIGRFLVRPTWTDTPPEHADAEVLVIDPKMSFGTGYHESTRLALRLVPEAVEDGDLVLDVGTGTGVLAVAACRLRARRCIAVDTDDNAVENARENVAQNDVSGRVDVRRGSMQAVPEDGFDVVLANINRNVLVDLMPAFARAAAPGAALILAGLLDTDRDLILQHAADAGFELASERQENGWIGLLLRGE
jgi:ribosomal protein L11 methyltransferase